LAALLRKEVASRSFLPTYFPQQLFLKLQLIKQTCELGLLTKEEQSVLSFNFPTEETIEGSVKILVPKLRAFVKEPWEYAPSKAPVFYNPAMELNRDFAVLALQTYQELAQHDVLACEPLTGCGVRGIRLVKEVHGISKVVINDINNQAASLAKFNVESNNLADKISVRNEDANLLLSRYAAPRRRFNYVDIDPFGSPAPYMDSAVRALRNHGLIALTATDMAPLCGVHPNACVRKYGGKPLRSEYCHELATRLFLACLVMQAAKHDVGIHPKFSYSQYNYVRTYASIDYGAKPADKSIRSLGFVLHCFSCFHRESQEGLTRTLPQLCPECGKKLQAAGPLWLGSLWDHDFCIKMQDEVSKRELRHKTKIKHLLSLIIEETNAPITYYAVDKMCDKFNLPVPPLSRIIDRLNASGFQASRTHFNPKAVRTDAPASAVRETITQLTRVSSSNHSRNHYKTAR
jgi:tRNA (guanine26-N2/guanine27-N2)-dimethyltransferase